MSEQVRFHITFSADKREATIASERWAGGQRVAAVVWPPVRVDAEVVCQIALSLDAMAFPSLFD